MNIPELHKVLENPGLPQDPAAALPVVQKLLSEYAQKINQLVDWAGTSKVSEDDQNPNWLYSGAGLGKLKAGSNITLTVEQAGTDELLTIAAAAGSGANFTIFNPGYEKASTGSPSNVLAGGAALSAQTVTFDVTDTGSGGFNFTSADVDAVLLRCIAWFTSSTTTAAVINIGATGSTTFDQQLRLDSDTLTLPGPPLTGNVSSGFASTSGLVRTDGSKQISVVISGTGLSQCYMNLHCFGYASGFTRSN